MGSLLDTLAKLKAQQELMGKGDDDEEKKAEMEAAKKRMADRAKAAGSDKGFSGLFSGATKDK